MNNYVHVIRKIFSVMNTDTCMYEIAIDIWKLEYVKNWRSLASNLDCNSWKYHSLKEEYIRGKAITSLQFLSEPSNIVICIEANLNYTICSWIHFNPLSHWITFGKSRQISLFGHWICFEKNSEYIQFTLHISFEIYYQPNFLDNSNTDNWKPWFVYNIRSSINEEEKRFW